MKRILFFLLFSGNLYAKNWVIEEVCTNRVSETQIQLHITIRNISGGELEVWEDQLSKGQALVNYYYQPARDAIGAGLMPIPFSHHMLFSRPCHGLRSRLSIKPGELARVSLPDYKKHVGRSVRLVLGQFSAEKPVGYFVIPEPVE